MGADLEFFSRPEWEAVQDAYGLEFAERRPMDPSLMYQAAGEALDGAIDAPTMRSLNHAVDGEGRSPAEVAADLLSGLP